MNARDHILAGIRAALRNADRRIVEVPVGYRDSARPSDLVGLFVERVTDYRAVVRLCRDSEVPDAIREALGDARQVIVPDEFPYEVAGSVPDTGQSPSTLDSVDAVVTMAATGIAATGTIVLDHGPGQGRRTLSLIPDLHVCVIRSGQIVPGVPDAIACLDPSRAQTWISGPSATSDIELNRVEGVHGPRNLHVIVVDETAF